MVTSKNRAKIWCKLTEEITQRKGFGISPFLIVYRGSLLDIEPSFGLTHSVVLVRISRQTQNHKAHDE